MAQFWNSNPTSLFWKADPTSWFWLNLAATYSYDLLGRLTEMSYEDGTPSLGYNYDSMGNRTYLGLPTYSYDADGRLLTIFYPDGTTVNYSYDAMGNRSSVTTTVGG